MSATNNEGVYVGGMRTSTCNHTDVCRTIRFFIVIEENLRKARKGVCVCVCE